MIKYIFKKRFCNSCINPSHRTQRWVGVSNSNIPTHDTPTYSSNHRFKWCAYPKTCKFLHDYRTIEKYGQCMDNVLFNRPN